MKSIKKKAVEYAKTKHTDNLLIEIVSWDFEAGANYVLDAIIECMPNTHSFNSNEAIDIIASRIKELKGNQ